MNPALEGYLALLLVAAMFVLSFQGASFILPLPMCIWIFAWLFAISGSRRATGVARAVAVFSLAVLVLHGIVIAVIGAAAAARG
jgi:hypothetical protein